MKLKERSPRMVAMDYLARREHTRFELVQKLQQKGFDPDEVDAVIDRLQAQGLQSDRRFADSYVVQRASRGVGPVRIQMELKQRGLDECLIDSTLSNCDIDWNDIAQAVWNKKFGVKARDANERAKQYRFMLQRGFLSFEMKE